MNEETKPLNGYKDYPVDNNGRIDFSKISGSAPLPNLVEIQTKSFEWFLNEGLDEVMKEVFPIANYAGTVFIDYVSSRFEDPVYDPLTCREGDLTYARKLKVTLRLRNKATGEIREDNEVFMGDIPMMSVEPTRLVGWGRFIKRLFDIIASLLAIIILSPIFLLVYIAEKITDPHASAVFHQIRLTRGDQKFMLYKFRTQYAKYDGTTPEQAFKKMGQPELIKQYRDNGDFLDDDPRVTPIGKYLRRLSLDELPQLFNVLKGDISLVGPRALIPQELNKYEQKHKILNVKSGITGLAQISGRRDLPWEQRRKLDVYYVQHWSFALDIQILFKTAWQVFTSKGAV